MLAVEFGIHFSVRAGMQVKNVFVLLTSALGSSGEQPHLIVEQLFFVLHFFLL